MKKSEIRKQKLNIRKKYSTKKFTIKFEVIFRLLKKLRPKGKILGGYYPYNNEIDVLDILKRFEKKNYNISLPKIKSNYEMDFLNWSSNDPLIINKYGIPEPTSSKIIYPDIIFVPLVAFDERNNRIGYGGGFYDRYLKKIKRKKKILTIGLAYSIQKIKKIPVNKHDIRLDFVITEKENQL